MGNRRDYRRIPSSKQGTHALSTSPTIGLASGENVSKRRWVSEDLLACVDRRRSSLDAPYTCDLVRYSKSEAKLEKGFKAVSCKTRLSEDLLCRRATRLDRSAPSMACFTAASALLIIAIFLFTRGLCKRRRKAVFFISGLLFSISGEVTLLLSLSLRLTFVVGLLTMVGVTLYVSITTEESVKVDQDYPVMKCFYGYSFLCAVFSFVLQELTGVLTVYWFIYRFRALVRKQEKLRERTRQLMGNCLSMTTALPLNLATFNGTSKPLDNHSNHHSPANNVRYQYVIGDQQNSLNGRQQRRRLPFDRSPPPLVSQQRLEKVSSPSRSPTLPYGDYCRVLIRAEDMELLSQMVKSRSQAHQLANSRPSTPCPTATLNVKALANSHNHPPARRASRKGVKRTTSV